MPTEPTTKRAKTHHHDHDNNFVIRGDGKRRERFQGSMYDFLAVLYGKDPHGDYGRKLFVSLEDKFADVGGLKSLCKHRMVRGERVPTMSMKYMERMLFCLTHKDVARARTLQLNFKFGNILQGDTQEITDHIPAPPKQQSSVEPKGQAVNYYKLELYKDDDPVRGVTHTDKSGATDVHWSVFDFLCVIYNHKTSDTFGRVKYSQIDKSRNGELERLATRIKIRKAGAETPTLTADQLISLMMMFKHPSCELASEACEYMRRLAADHTQCAEMSVDVEV